MLVVWWVSQVDYSSLNPLWLVGVETGARLSWDCIVGTSKVLGSASTRTVRYSRERENCEKLSPSKQLW